MIGQQIQLWEYLSLFSDFDCTTRDKVNSSALIKGGLCSLQSVLSTNLCAAGYFCLTQKTDRLPMVKTLSELSKQIFVDFCSNTELTCDQAIFSSLSFSFRPFVVFARPRAENKE